MERLIDKVAIVTGGGGGIGGATARALAREGASVVVVDIDQSAADVLPWVDGITMPVLYDPYHLLTETYAITNVQLTNAGNYAVQISNAYGSVLSSVAFLSVTAPLSNAMGAVIAPAGLVNWWPANGNAIDIVNTNNGLPANGFFYAPGEAGPV